MEWVLAAILFLVPLSEKVARGYAETIYRESRRVQIDPLLVVAIIKAESDFKPRRISKTHDWGLLQLHVSQTTHRSYLGKEQLLFNPTLSIKLGVKLLAFWRSYHLRTCRHARHKSKHKWYHHYQWGKRIRSGKPGARVDRIYTVLQEKFHVKGELPLVSWTP